MKCLNCENDFENEMENVAGHPKIDPENGDLILCGYCGYLQAYRNGDLDYLTVLELLFIPERIASVIQQKQSDIIRAHRAPWN